MDETKAGTFPVRAPRTDPVFTGQQRPFEIHMFVCTTGPECPNDAPAEAIRIALKDAAKKAGLKDKVRVNHSGCLDQCGHGPNMVVYPDGVWYSHLTVESALRIFNEHILGGQPVNALRYRLGPGACKAVRGADGKSLCHGECRA